MGERRYFRSTASTYESIRQQLDAAWGYPSDFATTCIEPAATAPRDSRGRRLLAVWSAFCDYEAVAAILPGLLDSGAVEEVDEATYNSASQPTP